MSHSMRVKFTSTSNCLLTRLVNHYTNDFPWRFTKLCAVVSHGQKIKYPGKN